MSVCMNCGGKHPLSTSAERITAVTPPLSSELFIERNISLESQRNLYENPYLASDDLSNYHPLNLSIYMYS